MSANPAPRRSVVIAPDSFKGSLAATDVAAAMAAGVEAVFGDAVTIVQCPLAAGGEDTLDAFVRLTAAEIRAAGIPRN